LVKIESLMKQASDTADVYLNRAATAVDERFGEGYAAKNPTLVVAHMRVAAMDFDTMVKFRTDSIE